MKRLASVERLLNSLSGSERRKTIKMERLVCLLIGYIFGLFQTGYFYGKTQGVDIRKMGSGNAGSTNALRTMGIKAGMITLLGDCFKCVIAVLGVRGIYGQSHADILPLLSKKARPLHWRCTQRHIRILRLWNVLLSEQHMA